MATKKEISHGKQFKGVVVSNKMDKTIVVSVSRFVKHPTRPISRDKHFRLV